MSRRTVERIVAHCATRPGAAEEHPFGETPAVYKVGGKIFALIDPDGAPPSISLKCDPALALELRAVYQAVTPGYHLNKRHWNTIALDEGVPVDELHELVDHSYGLVVAALPRRLRDALPASPP
jgi:predicted DNA-binding protein (MmcQ/YjbR family)